MNLSRKYLIIGIILIAVAWVGNLIYYQRHVLKHPVFTKHYYDIPRGMKEFRLYYIDNISSERIVTQVIFPEIDDSSIFFNENKYNTDDRYYRLNIINVSLPWDPRMPEDKYTNKVITRAKVSFNDGTILEADLGKIYLSSEWENSESRVLLQSGSSGTDDGVKQWGHTLFTANAYLKIHGMSSKFPELFGDMPVFKINGMPLKEVSFPIELTPGEALTIGYEFDFSSGDMRGGYVYDFPVQLSWEDNFGNVGDSLGFINYNIHSPRSVNMEMLLKEGGIK